MATTLENISLKPGDSVTDKTAEQNGWTDLEGKVLQTDGPHVRVEYTSGTVRAKLAVNLRFKDDPTQKTPTIKDAAGSPEEILLRLRLEAKLKEADASVALEGLKLNLL